MKLNLVIIELKLDMILNHSIECLRKEILKTKYVGIPIFSDIHTYGKK